MTTDLHLIVRRAFDDIIDATPDLGPCPAPADNEIFVERTLRLTRRPDQPSSERMERHHAGLRPDRSPRWVAIAAGIVLIVGVASVALITQRSDRATTATRSMVDLGPVDQFAAGSVASIDDPPLFVVNDPTTAIMVFDAHSTHLGCLLVQNGEEIDPAVSVNDPGVGFIDPCHGSLFDRVGNKLAGPAPRSMDRYRVTISDDQHLIVDLSQRTPGRRSSTPTYSGADLDSALPIVGRAWADSMDFSLSPDTNARLYNVWQAAIADCMHTSGFPDYQPVTFPANGNFQDLVNPLDRRYASVMGYHELPAEPIDANTYTDDTFTALNGPDGCGNASFAATFGRISDYTVINDQLRSGIASAIAGFRDSEIGSTVTSQWAACMADKGQLFTSRSDAFDAYADKQTISAPEIETRLADLDCDLTVGYTQQQHDWEQAQIDTWRAAQQDTIANALTEKRLAEQRLTEIETASYGSPQK